MSNPTNTTNEHRLQEYVAHLTAVLGHADRIIAAVKRRHQTLDSSH